jgi:cell division protein FtsA
MNKGRIIAGIEVGSSKVSTIIAQLQTDSQGIEKEISIIGSASVESKGIKKAQIVNIEEAVDSIVQSVEGAERMAGYNLDNAYVAIGGAHIGSQNSHGVVAVSDPKGEINESDVDRVVEAASAVSLASSREIIHILPREYVVDGEAGVKDPIGMTAVRLEVQTHLITASNASVNNLKKAVNEVGIKVNDLVFSGLASSEAVLTKTEKELGCALIDIGGGTTTIAVYIDGALSYSSVIPIGANNVTNDLAIGLRVSLETAEKIKLYLSDNEKKKKKKDDESSAVDELDLQSIGIDEIKKVSRKTLVEGIIRPRLNEIFTMVKLQLDKDFTGSQIPAGIILTGGGAETVIASDSAKRTLGLPIRIGKPKGVTGLIDDIMQPLYATPLGLIMYGAEQEHEAPTSPFAGKFKLPQKGFLQKIVKTFKDLLP